MDADEYRLMDAVEDRMWWYRALHVRVADALRDADGPVLDAGCGTGGLLVTLSRSLPSQSLAGIDVSAQAIALASRKVPDAALSVASVMALPFADASFGAVVSCDVLSHRMVEEAQAMAELARVLRPGGRLVLNMPAHQFLYAAHDRRVHNRRRFSRSDLAAMLAGAGLQVRTLRHWNSLLFPLMLVQRLVVAPKESDAGSDVAAFSPPLEAIFRSVTALERRLNQAGIRFPFGGSLLAVAEKP